MSRCNSLMNSQTTKSMPMWLSAIGFPMILHLRVTNPPLFSARQSLVPLVLIKSKMGKI